MVWLDHPRAAGAPTRRNSPCPIGTRSKGGCNLKDQVPVASSLLGYHLNVLRESALVEASRRVRRVDYTLAADAADRLRDALPTAVLEPVR